MDAIRSTTNTASSSLAASIVTVNGTLTTTSSSLAGRVDSISSGFTTASSSLASSITSTNSALSTASSSLATRVSTLSSSVGSATSSLSASISTTATTLASVSGSVVNLSSEYGVNVTAGRVTGFKILSSPTVSDFTIQADKFQIVNSSGAGNKSPFIVESGVTYIDGAVIKNLDANKINAGTISATIKLTAAKLESPEITGSSFMINSRVGMRYQDNNGTITITGGSDNGESNGAQIDLVGSGGAAAGSRGTLVLTACNIGTTSGDGTIRFRTSGSEQAILQRDGTFELNHSSTDNGFKGASIRFGTSTASTDRAISCNFAADGACLTYAGGTGVTGVLTTLEAHRWVDSGNNNELMALTTGGNLYVQTDVYADNFVSPSSERLKTNIETITGSLYVISKLKPVSFDWKSDNKHDTGLIAEQVQEILPHIVSKTDGIVQGLDYAKIVPYLIGAIHELENKIAKLEKQ